MFEEGAGTSSRLHPLDRPKFGELLTYARPGATLHISEMFRLVRGTGHILDVLDVLHRDRLALHIHDGAFSGFGISRFLAGRPMAGEKRTNATFWRSVTRVLPKVEGRVSRSSHRTGRKRLTFRIGAPAAAGGLALAVLIARLTPRSALTAVPDALTTRASA
ncbi:recombinase family protein [Streptomyces sp. NPDC093586]|uniref:recombinase family protein n=1 Tax=Streptomyces sp. NPDC093586 TaxID=3366042 RepID=UPI003824D290